MAVIAEIRAQYSAEHPVFYEDEVDIHLNPPKLVLTGNFVANKVKKNP